MRFTFLVASGGGDGIRAAASFARAMALFSPHSRPRVELAAANDVDAPAKLIIIPSDTFLGSITTYTY